MKKGPIPFPATQNNYYLCCATEMNKYKKIRLKGSKKETRDEHRLIMEKSLGRKLTFNEIVHHDDTDKSNNSPENLKLMTRSEHMKHHLDNGDIPRGELSEEGRLELVKAQSSVTQETAFRIKYGGEKPGALIKELGISKFTISRIRTGKSWACI